jgi:hypothetical protein
VLKRYKGLKGYKKSKGLIGLIRKIRLRRLILSQRESRGQNNSKRRPFLKLSSLSEKKQIKKDRRDWIACTTRPLIPSDQKIMKK